MSAAGTARRSFSNVSTGTVAAGCPRAMTVAASTRAAQKIARRMAALFLRLREAHLLHFLDGLLHDFGEHLRAALWILGHADTSPQQVPLGQAVDQRFDREKAIVALRSRRKHCTPALAVIAPVILVVRRRPRARRDRL